MRYRHGDKGSHCATRKGRFGYIMKGTQRKTELRHAEGVGEGRGDNKPDDIITHGQKSWIQPCLKSIQLPYLLKSV